MSDLLLLPAPEVQRQPIWKRWKWIGLVFFGVTLALSPWIPGWLTAIGSLYGTLVLLNLAFHLARYLKDRFFWRVRHRIIGSFIFVGLIPLVLISGVLFLSGYVLFGQLSSHYLGESLLGLEEEILGLGIKLAEQLPQEPQPDSFDAAAQRLIAKSAARFPHLAVLLLQKQPVAGYSITRQVDPRLVLPSPLPERIPVDSWLADRAFFHDVLRFDKTAWIASVQPLPRWDGYATALLVPLDPQIQQLLEKEKSVYVEFMTVGRTQLKQTRRTLSLETKESDNSVSNEELEPRLNALNARKKNDSRRMLRWGALVEGFDLATGDKEVVVFGILSLPLEAIYETYLAGTEDSGRLILSGIAVLLGLLAAAELISLIIGFTINRRITQSVNDLYRGTLALQEGDLQHRIPVRRHDQLGLLAHSFNQMSSSVTRLLEAATEKKRLEQELEIAREVQASLFPKQLPHARGLAVYGGCEPARGVSGDYYDFIFMDDARLHIIVGDISGKGISAALLMASLQAAARNQLMGLKEPVSADPEASLASFMEQLNRQMYQNSPSEKYATLFALRYDALLRRLSYCNAGHLPPYLLMNGSVLRLETGGTVLGLFEEASYSTASLELPAGATLAIFTDGISDAVNPADEEFGEPRLLEALQESAAASPEEIYQHIIRRVRQWQGAAKQHDDITLIVSKTN